MKLFSFRYPATIAATSLVAIVSIAAIAQAATDTIYKYTTPKNGTFSINPMAMAQDSMNSDYAISWNSGRLESPGGIACFNTGVNLPQGATITGLKTFWSNSTGSASFWLYRAGLAESGTTLIASGGVHDNTGTRKPFKAGQITAGAEIVNNNQYSYGFGICTSGANSFFYGAAVSYTYTNAGD